MRFRFHKNFEKAYQKASHQVKNKFKNCLKLLTQNEFDPTLNNHLLQGKYSGYRSINVTGDIRAIQSRLNPEAIIFVTLGLHGDLYFKINFTSL